MRVYLLYLLLMPLLSYADIYQCRNASNNIKFSDKPCQQHEITLKISAEKKVPTIQARPKTPAKILLSDTAPSKLIYSDHRSLKKPYSIKVNEVRIISESNDSLEVDVIYTYQHKIPADEIKLYVMPNHSFWRMAPQQISRGKNVARISIGLSAGNMKKKHRTRSRTDKLTISFDHYQPKKLLGSVWSKTIVYKKRWWLSP